MTSKHKRWIDISKGLGILLVEFSHIGLFPGFWLVDPFFVSVFFLISGYTYKNESVPYRNFILKKARRLLVPYLFFNVIYLGVNAFLHQDVLLNAIGILYSRFFLYAGERADNITFLSMLDNSPTWYLTAMFVALIFFKVLMDCEKKVKLLMVGVFILLTFVLNKLPILLPWSIDCAFLFAILMLVGYTLKEKDVDGLIAKTKKSTLALSGLVLIAVYVLLTMYNGKVNLSIRVLGQSVIVMILTASLGSILCMGVSKCLENNLAGKWLAVVGNHSLTIFCTHLMVFTIIRKGLSVVGMAGTDTFPFNAVIVLVTTVVCIGLSKVLKKYTTIV